jgi:hypothetical protein
MEPTDRVSSMYVHLGKVVKTRKSEKPQKGIIKSIASHIIFDLRQLLAELSCVARYLVHMLTNGLSLTTQHRSSQGMLFWK